jgi:hypothetical protein
MGSTHVPAGWEVAIEIGGLYEVRTPHGFPINRTEIDLQAGDTVMANQGLPIIIRLLEEHIR